MTVPADPVLSMSIRQLRNRIRQQRRTLGDAEASRCANQLALRTAAHALVTHSKHIAAYLATDGEMNTWPLLSLLWAKGKKIYLPVLTPGTNNKLGFARFDAADMLAYNRFGILEPVRRTFIKPTALDLVLAPLVAFDEAGHRIGMGGGYYDRSFAFLNQRKHWHKPRLFGLAYELQKLDSITPNDWDLPLDAIATETTIYTPGR